MANDGFNGSTVTFDSVAVGDLLSIDYSDSVEAIDTTDSADTSHKYLTGIPDPECSVEVVGVPSLSVAATGTLSVAWFDGTTDTMTASVLTEISSSGSVDDKISTTLTFKPSAV